MLYSLQEAFAEFVIASATQSGKHIAPLHWHIATRLVVEGGFHPDTIVPRPPFRCESLRKRTSTALRLVFDEDSARPGEMTVLGGLKTKDVDVVVSLPGIGPALAISVKGTIGAFRNLTNRMEEAAGDCTNIHMAYPTLVYGFLHIMRANRQADGITMNDVAILLNGEVVDSIRRFHDAMARLAGRKDIRNDLSRYEAIGLALVEVAGTNQGAVLPTYPLQESPLQFSNFFSSLYRDYDLRFVYGAQKLRKITSRSEWKMEDQLVSDLQGLGFFPRLAT